MKLKVQQVMDAVLVLAQIINEQRAMPQLGKYRLARMHARLLPEFKVMDAKRDEMIKAYGNPQTKVENLANGEVLITPIEGQWQVPPEHMPEFIAAWKEIGDAEIEVDVLPIPLSALTLPAGGDGAIEASELITLGELISE